MTGRGKPFKQMSIVDSLVQTFTRGGELELKAKAVYFNPQYRKLNLAVENLEQVLGLSGDVLSWKAELEKNKSLSTPFSYYEKNGESKYSLIVKVPADRVAEIAQQYKSMTHFKVELKAYQDYPTPGKNGLWLQLK